MTLGEITLGFGFVQCERDGVAYALTHRKVLIEDAAERIWTNCNVGDGHTFIQSLRDD